MTTLRTLTRLTLTLAAVVVTAACLAWLTLLPFRAGI